ncbi:MAG: hypothetical protein IT378_01465, partial [Sandaracinaceae bacterium]|nr:hypothetical protein [Sandaracinaceae bacterium]
MDGLPFTVAYGQAIWIATLALGPLAGVWWLLRRRSARSRSAHRLERRAFQPARTSVEGVADGELVCLEGRLASRGAPAARLEDGAPCAATTIGPATGEPWAGARAEELVLRVAGVEVELEGPIRVARSTHEAWPDSPLKQLDAPLLARASTLDGGAAVLAQLGDRRVAIRSLAHGARVRVRGALVRKSAVEGGRAYRHSAHRVALAAPRGSALSAQAVASPTLALPPLLALGAGALLGLFAWIALCIGAGALSAGVIHAERAAPLEHPRAEASSALVAAGLIGAATPSARALALETLAGAWSAGGPPSEERADVAIELAGLRGCAARVQALMRHQRFEEALAVAESCPEPEARLLAMHTAWLLGDFERVVDERRRFAAQAWRAEVPELGLGQDRTGIARLLIGDREQASLELDAPDGECVLGAIRGFGARGGAAACVLARAARLEGPARRAHLEPLLSEGSLSCVGPRLGRPARLASCPPGMEASGGVAVALYLGALDGFRGDEAHELVGERTVPWSPRSLLSDCP